MAEWRAWCTSAGWLGMPDAPGGYRWLGTNRAPPLTRRVPWFVLAGRRVAVIEPHPVAVLRSNIVARYDPLSGRGGRGDASHLLVLVRVRGGRWHGRIAPPPAHRCP